MEVPFNIPRDIIINNLIKDNDLTLNDIFALFHVCKNSKNTLDDNFWQLIFKTLYPKIIKLDNLTWKNLALLLINKNNMYISKIPFTLGWIYIKQLLLFKSCISPDKLEAYQYVVTTDVRHYAKFNSSEYTDEMAIIPGPKTLYNNIVLAVNYYDALSKLFPHYNELIEIFDIDYNDDDDGGERVRPGKPPPCRRLRAAW